MSITVGAEDASPSQSQRPPPGRGVTAPSSQTMERKRGEAGLGAELSVMSSASWRTPRDWESQAKTSVIPQSRARKTLKRFHPVA